MGAIRGTWHDGHVVLDQRVEWPDGHRVLVEAVAAENVVGMSEADWDNSPEGIAAWLQWYDSLEPLEFTAEEESQIL